MIDDILVKKLLSQIVKKDYEENLKKRFREVYLDEPIPEGMDNLIGALELPPEELQLIDNNIQDSVDNTITPIIKSLINGIETDEEIAEKTGIKLNIVRKILYKLYDLKIANYKRSKDPETQWFTYSWKFEKDELISKIKKDTEIELSKLNAQLEEEEQNMFFVCPYGHVRVNFDVASDYDYQFLCPACDEELEFQDNAEIIENLKANIAMVENDYDSFIKKVESWL